MQVYQEPPLDPEHLITSFATRAEAQLRSKQIADSVLVKAMKVMQASAASVHTHRQASDEALAAAVAAWCVFSDVLH